MMHVATLAAPETAARRVAALLDDDEAPLGAVDVAETRSGWLVSVYFEAEPEADTLARLAKAAAAVLGPDAGFAVAPLPEQDWIAMSLAGLSPVRVGRFLVHGAHDRHRRRANDVAIEIEAGEAFGTGHHGTTAGCLAAIAALGRQRRFRRPLDLGTGSGVLAIAMARAWHVPVLASDIDPVAVRVARANARLNRVAGLVETVAAAGFVHPAFRQRAPFDLIVANILAGPLMALAPALERHLAADGVVVLSGLIPVQRARVVAAYRGRGLYLRRASVREGWLTLILGR